MTFKELVYMVLDEIKGISDDFTFTEDHVIFLLNKYRAFLLKQRYSDIKRQIPESNYQTICLDLENINLNECFYKDNTYVRSVQKIPFLMTIGNPKVTSDNYYIGEFNLITKERMRYTGYNKHLRNIIYCSIGPDAHLYFKSSNTLYQHLEKVRFTGIFQDAAEASELNCETNKSNCDILNREFPMEYALVPNLIELVVKELLGAAYRPNDNTNNANDDLADMMSYIRNNMKKDSIKELQ